jgi:HEAT repeat protein
MISQEEAQERLKSFHNPEHESEQLARLQKLSSKLSRLGQILIQAGPEWEKLQKQGVRGAWYESHPDLTFHLLSASEKSSLFAALFPGIASYLEDAWNLFDLLPYQASYQRRPFRNPKDTTLEARVAWLQRLPHALRGYEHQDITWLAAWASHMGYWGSETLGYLFAAAIAKKDKTGDEIFNILVASANGTHETGIMGRHVVRALLCSPSAKGWEYIERMLLAAQREEGLRQVILEAIDEAHPQAFRRILRLVVDQNLTRFSAAIRACSVWFGLPFEVTTPKTARAVLEQVLYYLDSPSAREEAVQSGSAQDAYYALWAMAFDEAPKALPHAIMLAQSPDVEKRFAATHLLGQLQLSECLPPLLAALEDEDLRICSHALFGIGTRNYDAKLIDASDLFERLERLLPRLKHKKNTLKPLVWDWLPIQLDRQVVSGLLIDCRGSRSLKRLIPYLSVMNPRDRARVARILKESKDKDEEILQTLLILAGDLSPDVRETAIKGLHGIKLHDPDIAHLEGLLSRQSEGLRRAIIELLLELPDEKLLESIHRLIGHRGENQRFAALELMKLCKESQRFSDQVQGIASEYKGRTQPSNTEMILLNEILAEAVEKYSLDDALGLLDPENRTKPQPVKKDPLASVKLGSAAAIACLRSLDALVEEHRNDVIEMSRGEGKAVELLGNLRWGWVFYPAGRSGVPDFESFPLSDMSEAWWQSRPATLRDQDGYELLRAYAVFRLFAYHPSYFVPAEKGIPRELQKFYGVQVDFDFNYREMIGSILQWLIWKHPPQGEIDFVLGALAEAVAKIPRAELTGMKTMEYSDIKVRALDQRRLNYLDIARWLRNIRPDAWTNNHHAMLWKIVCWLNEPEPGLPGSYAVLEDVLFAYQAGAATRDDLFYMFLGPRKKDGYGIRFGPLYQFSGRNLRADAEPLLKKFPVIAELLDACRERILDVECKRGELPTAATHPARSIRSVPGMRNLFRLLVALDNTGFERGYRYGHDQSRSAVFSSLIRNSYPIESDTLEAFAEQARLHAIPEKRLIELAVYAPQWSRFVEHTTGWEHLSDAVWWLYAHTKDRQWRVEAGIREEWAARISEHTPLSADDLMDGAVDVTWFQQIYAEMGEERWQQLYDAAIYTSGGIGHGRTRLFSDAMLGKTTVEKESTRALKKRNQDSVRALGLIPLGANTQQKVEVLRRYEVMQEFLRTGKKFGSQRKASEKLAISIGMQNLARTAGYSDPQRLEWAMEVEAVRDLTAGPIVSQVDEYRIALNINDLGEPVLEFRKKDKPIKTLPSLIKKNERVVELLERKQQLDRQVSRMYLSLEQSMCRGDEFTISEIHTLLQHPMLRVMLEQLVLVSAIGSGYPVRSGQALCDHAGKEVALKDSDIVRIAHPLDLLESKEWHLWQRECFVAERIQPFKQIFRELYVLTANEKDEGNVSRRYAGQQVHPRQAAALFGQRGWVVDPSEGVQKTFHQEGISARVGFLSTAFTPAEVEGWTIEGIVFTKRGEWQALKMEAIPPRIFSEVMRDLDLVVSVAHAGGIDPEASTSSIESRSALIRETAALLKLGNVKLSAKHVIIDGTLANYNVNLGSGVVHKQPGGALCIIPVHSQHRGRIFLPFVDNDPKTAEIVSKVILLARDEQIKDPTILEQILL